MRKGPSLQASEGARPCGHLYLKLQASRARTRLIPLLWSTQVVVLCSSSLSKLIRQWMRLKPQNSSQLGLIYTLDRVCNPYGNPGTDGAHQGTECRVMVPGRMAQAPLTPTVPSPVPSHSGYCCCCGQQLRAAVEQLNTNATRQPDLGLSVACTPSPLVGHGIPAEARLGDTASCTTPRG